MEMAFNTPQTPKPEASAMEQYEQTKRMLKQIQDRLARKLNLYKIENFTSDATDGNLQKTLSLTWEDAEKYSTDNGKYVFKVKKQSQDGVETEYSYVMHNYFNENNEPQPAGVFNYHTNAKGDIHDFIINLADNEPFIEVMNGAFEDINQDGILVANSETEAWMKEWKKILNKIFDHDFFVKALRRYQTTEGELDTYDEYDENPMDDINFYKEIWQTAQSSKLIKKPWPFDKDIAKLGPMPAYTLIPFSRIMELLNFVIDEMQSFETAINDHSHKGLSNPYR